MQFNSNVSGKVNFSETEQFNHVYEAYFMFKKDPTSENYNNLFIKYLQLGVLLGYNEEDIQTAYYQKNEVNYERQKQGY